MFPFKSNRSNFLILIGGAEDKKGDKALMKRILEVTKARNIIIVPTASFYPHEVSNHYIEAFKKLEIRNIDIFDIQKTQEADREEFLAKLDTADLIYFCGGDQVKLVDTLKNTQLYRKVNERFTAGKLSVVCTSSAAAAAGETMIFDGDYQGFTKGAVNSAKSFGFIQNIIIDSHFISRGRISRLVQFLLTGKESKGIGLAEDTAIIISSENTIEVAGSNMVTILSVGKNLSTNYNQINNGDLYSANNVNLGFLAPGVKFDLKTWTIVN